MKKMFGFVLTTITVLFLSITALADVRVKQKVTTAGQSFETTRSIKGSRERTEQKIETADPQAADYFPQISTITQCDLKRTVRLNDRKQLYMVEPFQTATDASTPLTRTTPAPPQTTTTRRNGGTVTMTYTVKDTGERKTIFGLQARHLIITQEMESSPDSCNGAMRTKTETDGWYVDFSADFNCPNQQAQMPTGGGAYKPDCIDRYVFKGSPAAKLGFLLEGTMKMYGTDGSVQMTTTTATLELSRARLDAALFEVPATYNQVNSSQDLYAISLPTGDETREPRSDRRPARNTDAISPSRPAARSIVVNISLGSSASGDQTEIENYIRGRVASRGLRPVPVGGDYTLNIQFRQIKESAASKIGGIFGKATGVSTGGVGKVDIDLTATISGGVSGEAKVRSKFDGPVSDAIRAAVDQALDQLLSTIEN